MRRALQIGLIVAAVCVAVTPLPRATVERAYSRTVYPAIQPRLTGASNWLPFALFDVFVGAVVISVAALWITRLLRRPRGATLQTIGHLLINTAAISAFVYFWFLVAWGLNYQREPLRVQLDFEEDRISTQALHELALRSIAELNRLYEPAHRAGWVDFSQSRSALDGPFGRAQHDLAMPWRAVAGRPKRSIFDFYFRRVSVEGMTDPFFLETLANQSLLPFERSFVVAHEWSHLAGFADESEANFLAWLICLRGAERDQYSSWISLWGTIVSAVPPRDREELAGGLQDGPKDDLRAMAERVARQVNPTASRAGYAAYDRFLRANRVRAGVRSYSEVLRLMLGTRFNPDGSPVLR
jgi:hypothetical protein